MKREKSCGCIVIDKSDNVLLVEMNAGHWSFPKGHVEINETEEETALRETFEETKIKCKIIDGFKEVSSYSPSDGTIKDVIFFVAKPISTDIVVQEEEINQALFVSFDRARELITFKNDLLILKKAINFLKNL